MQKKSKFTKTCAVLFIGNVCNNVTVTVAVTAVIIISNRLANLFRIQSEVEGFEEDLQSS